MIRNVRSYIGLLLATSALVAAGGSTAQAEPTTAGFTGTKYPVFVSAFSKAGATVIVTEGGKSNANRNSKEV